MLRLTCKRQCHRFQTQVWSNSLLCFVLWQCRHKEYFQTKTLSCHIPEFTYKSELFIQSSCLSLIKYEGWDNSAVKGNCSVFLGGVKNSEPCNYESLSPYGGTGDSTSYWNVQFIFWEKFLMRYSFKKERTINAPGACLCICPLLWDPFHCNLNYFCGNDSWRQL